MGMHGPLKTSDFKTERNLIRRQLNVGQEVIITSEEVCRTLKRVNTRKSVGPDRITGRILKECRKELSIIYSHLFQDICGYHYMIF